MSVNRWKLEQKIAEKAMQDEHFKKSLLKNPKEAIRKYFSTEIKDDKSDFEKSEVKIHFDERFEWTICLPAYLASSQQPLSPGELKGLSAAGGNCCWLSR